MSAYYENVRTPEGHEREERLRTALMLKRLISSLEEIHMLLQHTPEDEISGKHWRERAAEVREKGVLENYLGYVLDVFESYQDVYGAELDSRRHHETLKAFLERSDGSNAFTEAKLRLAGY